MKNSISKYATMTVAGVFSFVTSYILFSNTPKAWAESKICSAVDDKDDKGNKVQKCLPKSGSTCPNSGENCGFPSGSTDSTKCNCR